MESIKNLVEDHEIIIRALKLLEYFTNRLAEGRYIDRNVFNNLLEFFRIFADRCHHGKEEKVLFPLLERLGIPREGGPIDVMLYKHNLGRNLINNLSIAIERYYKGEQDAIKDITIYIREYTELLEQHIEKENNILFSMGSLLMSIQDDRYVIEKFEEIERNIGKHEEFIKAIEELERL